METPHTVWPVHYDLVHPMLRPAPTSILEAGPNAQRQVHAYGHSTHFQHSLEHALRLRGGALSSIDPLISKLD